MKHLKIFIISYLIFSISNFAFGETKVAFIDMQYIMNNSLAGQSIKKQLEDQHKKNLNNFKKNEDTLKKKEKEILSKKNILSKEEFEKEISSLRSEVKKYNNERNEKIGSLTQKRL